MDSFLDEVASPTPAPGGGAVAAQVAALGAALIEMAVGLGHRRQPMAQAQVLLAQVRALRERLVLLREADGHAFEGVLAAMRRPKTSDAEQVVRRQALDRALADAARVPMDVMGLTRELAAQVVAADPLALPSARSDLEVASILLQAAWRCAKVNVDVNLAAISDAALQSQLSEAVEGLGATRASDAGGA